MNKTYNIEVIKKTDNMFPWFLKEMEDAPEALFCIGDISLLTNRAAAVVGARKCSEYGRQTALKTGEMLAQNGVVTVSGMAVGIDSAAHAGALKAGGKTIAVLGCGPDICYPKVNRRLYEKICERGLVVSEFKPGTEARPWHFPMRNRIIAALSEIVTVIEAMSGSGALITALKAAEQGKEVFALPGNITSPFSEGTNRLIYDGAGILTKTEDILYAMDIEPASILTTEKNVGADELEILDNIRKYGDVSIEFLSSIMGKSPSYVSGIVSVMELKGILSYSMGAKVKIKL